MNIGHVIVVIALAGSAYLFTQGDIALGIALGLGGIWGVVMWVKHAAEEREWEEEYRRKQQER